MIFSSRKNAVARGPRLFLAALFFKKDLLTSLELLRLPPCRRVFFLRSLPVGLRL